MRPLLSPHIQNWQQTNRDEILSLRGPSLKILNTANDPNAVGEWLDRNPGSSLVIRQVWGSPDDELRVATSGKDGAYQALHDLTQTFRDCMYAAWNRGRKVYVEPTNEVINPWHQMAAMSDFYAWFAEACDRVVGSLLPLAYSIPAGNPPGYGSSDDPNNPNAMYPTRVHSLAAWIRDWQRGLEACDYRIAYHAYNAIRMINSEWTYLPGRATDLLTPAIGMAFGQPAADRVAYWFTEAGADGGVYSGRKDRVAGWQGQYSDFADPEGTYAYELDLAVRRWALDPKIMAIYPFLHGANGDWRQAGFGMDDTPKIARMWIKLYQESSATALPEGKPMEYQAIDVNINAGAAVYGENWRCEVRAFMAGQPCADGALTLEVRLPRNPDGDVTYSQHPIDGKYIYALDKNGYAVTDFKIPADAMPPNGGGDIGMSASVVDFAANPDGTVMTGFGNKSVTVPIVSKLSANTPAGPSPVQPGPTPEPFVPLAETLALPPAGTGYHRIFAIAGLQHQYAGKIQELSIESQLEIDRIKTQNPTPTR